MSTTQPVAEAIRGALTGLLKGAVEVERAVRIPGGASKEAWLVDARISGERLELLVRRAAGGVIYDETLSLEAEHRLFQAAYDNGVRVPRTYGYVADLAGREAFVMERVKGEGVGRRVVKLPELSGARAELPRQMAEALAAIHGIRREALPKLPFHGNPAEPPPMRTAHNLERRLDAVGEPHPAIELGIACLRRNAQSIIRDEPEVLVHGDFRIGNLLVDECGLTAVLDWEFAHWGDPAEDLAWPLVRTWRFGVADKPLGGIGSVEPFLEHYNRLTGRDIGMRELRYWELAGNVRWAIGSLNQARRHLSGQERSVELAVLGRLACEVEYEILCLLEQAEREP
ncbi:MAG TPA: phosphotransferase family protein [Burkholderiales bacterium]|nr:phosphotransferase family protein [Burkholderiales bacterium]